MTPEMPAPIHTVLVALSLAFVAVAAYHRIRSFESRERLDRTKEGWPILIGLRLTGLLTLGSGVAWLWYPPWFEWATVSVPEWVRWTGVAGFALSVFWLMWMFVTLGRNLTDTVVTRRDAKFVDNGPYRYVRNPMYTGILVLGFSLGLALGTWLLPLATTLVWCFRFSPGAPVLRRAISLRASAINTATIWRESAASSLSCRAEPYHGHAVEAGQKNLGRQATRLRLECDGRRFGPKQRGAREVAVDARLHLLGLRGAVVNGVQQRLARNRSLRRKDHR